MQIRFTLLIFFLMSALLTPSPVNAAPQADVQNDSATLDFPNTITFSATLTASANITSVTLEYGNDQLTCGDVIAKAFPQFDSNPSVDASWTWDMRQSVSLPPGATIWWRWRYTDETGKEFTSETQTITWLDNIHDWKTVSSGDIRIHYYDKDEAFANTMLDAGLEGLRRNKEQAGMTADAPVDYYIYPNVEDMRDAILYEPAWTGGQAFPEYNIVIMGFDPLNDTWNQNTVIHELTHILVGRTAFSCLGSRPGWLEEGLAMYSEGGLDENMQSRLDYAINSDSLITLRSLNGGFSELPDKANLSYSQSYSVVRFMIESYGQEKMTDLLTALRDAKPIDEALLEVYGVDTDGLDSAWRASVGAAPLAVAQATAMPTPTFVPTYVPISGVPLAVTPTPYAIPTSSFNGSDQPQETRSGPPIAFTIALLCFCFAFLLVIGVVVLGFVVRSSNAKDKGGKNG
ncbi:MAG TPA: peptidase MA family metallohydrolase [Anaerolineales bacterium]|nr:peptidase MA family metallohydrolase [Anaerolineales bacterium]HNN13873.1 peptidase MA family metallohydrolase [Anaerolineales bacterium]HNO30952.1 peptidase MA family metallohydrolase [Anaerolineales bacterium]